MPVILAFLQNQWGPSADDPAKAARIAAMSPEIYARWVAMCLFAGCMTGRRIQKAFPEHWEAIVWSNATRQAGTTATAKFSADLDHMRATLDHFRPEIVLGFGRVATDALKQLRRERGEWVLIEGPHPASRQVDTPRRLELMSSLVSSMLAAESQEAR
jgi:hypothetical protein